MPARPEVQDSRLSMSLGPSTLFNFRWNTCLCIWYNVRFVWILCHYCFYNTTNIYRKVWLFILWIQLRKILYLIQPASSSQPINWIFNSTTNEIPLEQLLVYIMVRSGQVVTHYNNCIPYNHHVHPFCHDVCTMHTQFRTSDMHSRLSLCTMNKRNSSAKSIKQTSDGHINGEGCPRTDDFPPHITQWKKPQLEQAKPPQSRKQSVRIYGHMGCGNFNSSLLEADIARCNNHPVLKLYTKRITKSEVFWIRSESPCYAHHTCYVVCLPPTIGISCLTRRLNIHPTSHWNK